MEGRTPPHLIFGYFLILFIASIALLGRLLWPFLSIIILACVVSGIFHPLYRAMARHMRPSLASLLTCLLIFLLLFIPLTLCVGVLSSEAVGLYASGRDAAIDRQVKDFLTENRLMEKALTVFRRYGIKLTIQDLYSGLAEVVRVVGLFLVDQARAIANNVLRFFVNFAFMLMVCYFLLIDGERLIAYITELSPLPQEQDNKIIERFKQISGSVLIMNGLSGLIQGTLGGVVFMLFGVPSSFLWGVVMAILAFLPIIGIGIVFVPAAVIFFIMGKFVQGTLLFCIYILITTMVDYVFKTKFLGNRVNMHPLLVLLSIFGGLKLFGILGVIYGPLSVTLFLTMADIYHASYQQMVEREAKESLPEWDEPPTRP
ncbi:MAG: AI-2E family transporter [Thermodesulfobacteriota bacterium]